MISSRRGGQVISVGDNRAGSGGQVISVGDIEQAVGGRLYL